MNSTQQHIAHKSNYAPPQIDIIRFSFLDIITASENGDENQGEWDPQLID